MLYVMWREPYSPGVESCYCHFQCSDSHSFHLLMLNYSPFHHCMAFGIMVSIYMSTRHPPDSAVIVLIVVIVIYSSYKSYEKNF